MKAMLNETVVDAMELLLNGVGQNTINFRRQLFASMVGMRLKN
jgi:hypothetical protein